MAESLFLNKNEIDIFEKPITRKIQIGDVGEVGTRKSSFSYSITIPMTSRNKRVLELLGVLGNTSRKPFEQIVCDYIVDGVYVVLNGVAVIKSSNGGYKLNIVDGIKGLADLLSGKKIEDLPLSDLDHNLTTQVFVDSFANTEGFIYGLADFGLGISSTVKVEKQAPSIYVHTIFRRIFESAGLNLVGEFFTTNEKYLTEVLTPSKGYLIEDNPLTVEAKGGASSNVLSSYATSNEFILIDREFTLSDAGLIGASIVNGQIIFGVAGTYRIDLSAIYSLYETFGSVVFLINGIEKSFLDLREGNSETKTKSFTFVVESGDAVSFRLRGSSALIGDENGVFSVNYTCSLSLDLFLESGGQFVSFSDYIGDMKQIDFIKDIINRYALVLQPVRATGNFYFKRLEELLNDRSTAEDWTSKVSEIGVENYVSGYAKSNKATFTYPEETAIPSNDGDMIIDNENASEGASLIASSFEIPVQKGSTSGNETFLIPIWSYSEGFEVVLGETPLKIMHVNRVDTAITAKLFEEVTGINVNEGVPFLNLDFINMQYFVGNFYKAFQSMINNYKAIDFKLNLSVIDIVNLDFFRLKYLKQTGRFYYLNSVQNTARKISKVNMIEIAEFPENLPPSQVGDFSFNMNRLQTRTLTYNNLTTGYEDPEVDLPLKVKIISGFNSDIVLKQDGIIITTETEILFDDLNLVVEEVLGGVDAYTKEWVYAIADTGSGSFGSVTGKIVANVGEFVNTPPVANAGNDETLNLTELSSPDGEPVPAGIYPYTLNGSASYDNTGEIIAYKWEIYSAPAQSGLLLDGNLGVFQSEPNIQARFEVLEEYSGDYTFKLTVKDEFGATDEDFVKITLNISKL